MADTIEPRLVWEKPQYPAYYVPLADVRRDLMVPSATVTRSPSRGTARHLTVVAGGREAVDAALVYEDSPIEELRDLVRLEWGSMDAWFEEDEEVHTHPRSPYVGVDILPSSRHVRVEVDGVGLADSRHARVLHETGLIPRWDIPKIDVRMDVLELTASATHCPYKGQAMYWSGRIGDRLLADLAWSYRTTLPEAQRIAGLVAFYDERVDVWIDGVPQERPRTRFARSESSRG